MRILGVQWLADVLHPGGPDNVVADTVSFYRDFLHVSISDDEARKLLGR